MESMNKKRKNKFPRKEKYLILSEIPKLFSIRRFECNVFWIENRNILFRWNFEKKSIKLNKRKFYIVDFPSEELKTVPMLTVKQRPILTSLHFNVPRYTIHKHNFMYFHFSTICFAFRVLCLRGRVLTNEILIKFRQIFYAKIEVYFSLQIKTNSPNISNTQLLFSEMMSCVLYIIYM